MSYNKNHILYTNKEQDHRDTNKDANSTYNPKSMINESERINLTIKDATILHLKLKI